MYDMIAKYLVKTIDEIFLISSTSNNIFIFIGKLYFIAKMMSEI